MKAYKKINAAFWFVGIFTFLAMLQFSGVVNVVEIVAQFLNK